MDKFEYKYAYVKDEEFDKAIRVLNTYGYEGWEFTGYTEDTGWGTKFLMKRKIKGL